MTPVRPLRPCTVPGCPALVSAGRCAAHERERQDARPKDPEQVRFYGSARWKRIRALVKAQQPVCEECQAKPTKVIDHRDGDWTNNDRANLRGLCQGCNDSRTARQHRLKHG